MTRQQIDMDLINKAKQGYQGAYSALFTHYYLSVYNYIKEIIKDPLESEDIAMITFEKAFRNLDKYAPLFTFKTWLFKVAKNASIDFMRCRKFKSKDFVVCDAGFLIKQLENPEHILMDKENLYNFEKALRNIPISHRKVFEMYEDDILCREIAKELNISISSVTGKIRYVRKWLCQKLLTKKQIS